MAKRILKTAVVEYRMIDSIELLLDWARNVNIAHKDGDHIWSLQDVFARSNKKDMKDLLLLPDVDRRLILFSIYKAMGDDVFMEFVNHYARAQMQNSLEEQEASINKTLDRRYDELRIREKNVRKAEATMAEGRKAIYKRIRSMADRIAVLGREAECAADAHRETMEHLKQERIRSREFYRQNNVLREHVQVLDMLRKTLKEEA